MRNVRRVVIGPNVKISDDGAELIINDKPLGEADVVEFICNTHDALNGTGQGIKASIRIAAAFKGKKPGDVVELEEMDWTMLKAAINAPSAGFFFPLTDPTTKEPVNLPGKCFLPYIDSVDKAEQVEA